MSILSMNSGVHRVVPTCDCPSSGNRLAFLFEPRAGVEYAIAHGDAGRVALGAWGGVEPFMGSWTTGLLLSARLNLVRGRTVVAF